MVHKGKIPCLFTFFEISSGGWSSACGDARGEEDADIYKKAFSVTNKYLHGFYCCDATFIFK